MDFRSLRLAEKRLFESFSSIRLALFLLVAVSTACASAGTDTAAPDRTTQTVFVSNRFGGISSAEVTNDLAVFDSLIAAPRSAVWVALPSVFETLDIETPAVDGRTLEIGNPGYTAGRIEGRRLSLFFDCGSSIGGARADRYQVTASVMVQISVADGGTLVRTRVGATAKQRSVSGNAVPCQSRRRLERRILELIGKELANEASR